MSFQASNIFVTHPHSTHAHREGCLVFPISMRSFNLYFWTISLSIHNVIPFLFLLHSNTTVTTTTPRRGRSLISYDVYIYDAAHCKLICPTHYVYHSHMRPSGTTRFCRCQVIYCQYCQYNEVMHKHQILIIIARAIEIFLSSLVLCIIAV